jgi:hypothetical protein
MMRRPTEAKSPFGYPAMYKMPSRAASCAGEKVKP